MPLKHLLSTCLTFVILLSPSLSLAQYTESNLYTLIRQGNMQAVKSHLKNELDENTLNLALGAAVVGNQQAIMQLLIVKGANVHFIVPEGSALLIDAIMYEHYDSAKLLIQMGADVNARGYRRTTRGMKVIWYWTPLMCATYKGQMDVVELLLEYGADMNESGWSQKDLEEETSTDIAAYSGHTTLLNYFLKKGGHISIHTLFKTVRSGYLENTKLTYKHFKKVFTVNTPGPYQQRTLLIEASWWGHPNIVRYLLKKRANVNANDRYGNTALIEAVRMASENLVKYKAIIVQLLKKKADVLHKNNKGESALKLAKSKKLHSIIPLLEKKIKK